MASEVADMVAVFLMALPKRARSLVAVVRVNLYWRRMVLREARVTVTNLSLRPGTPTF